MSENTRSSELDNFMLALGYHFEAAHPVDCECHEYDALTTVDGYWKDGDMIPFTEVQKAFEALITSKVEEARKHIAWVEEDRSGTNHLFIGDSVVSSHDPKLCPECIEPEALQSKEER